MKNGYRRFAILIGMVIFAIGGLLLSADAWIFSLTTEKSPILGQRFFSNPDWISLPALLCAQYIPEDRPVELIWEIRRDQDSIIFSGQLDGTPFGSTVRSDQKPTDFSFNIVGLGSAVDSGNGYYVHEVELSLISITRDLVILVADDFRAGPGNWIIGAENSSEPSIVEFIGEEVGDGHPDHVVWMRARPDSAQQSQSAVWRTFDPITLADGDAVQLRIKLSSRANISRTNYIRLGVGFDRNHLLLKQSQETWTAGYVITLPQTGRVDYNALLRARNFKLILPSVLIIGDSISIGYTKPSALLLKSKASVTRIDGNAQHTWNGLSKIDDWLASGKWDVIHFNWGLWDIAYRNTSSTNTGNLDKVGGTLTTTPEEYEQNLAALVERLKKTNAKLIWASTTPVPENEPGRYQEDVIKYNATAKKIMDANGVIINDLYSHVLPVLAEKQLPNGDVHFTEEGYEFLAEEVARILDEVISRGR